LTLAEYAFVPRQSIPGGLYYNQSLSKKVRKDDQIGRKWKFYLKTSAERKKKYFRPRYKGKLTVAGKRDEKGWGYLVEVIKSGAL